MDKGINDAVLPMSVTNEALELFLEAKWTVLGGDVYQYENNEMKNFYADWYCNIQIPSESCDYAKDHLSKLGFENLYVSFTIKY